VQQRGDERLGVEPQAGADLRDAGGMDDELLPGLAALVGMVLAREEERALDQVAVDVDDRLVGVLLDDREEVGQQPPLERRELGATDLGGVALGMLDLIDRRAPRRQAATAVGAEAVAAVVAVLRNRWSSSCLALYARNDSDRSSEVRSAAGTSTVRRSGSRLTSPSSARTRSARPACAGDRCGSPSRSAASSSSPAAVARALRAR